MSLAKEADIVIGGISLNSGQSHVVQLAVNYMLLEVSGDAEFRKAIGEELATLYRITLDQVRKLIVEDALLKSATLSNK